MKIVLLISIAALICGCSREEFSPVSIPDLEYESVPTFDVEFPGEGDKLFTGNEYEIKWKSSSPSAKVAVYLIKKKEYYKTYLAVGAANDGSLKWNVPSNTIPSNHYRIVIADHNLSSFQSYSKEFSILKIQDKP